MSKEWKVMAKNRKFTKKTDKTKIKYTKSKIVQKQNSDN